MLEQLEEQQRVERFVAWLACPLALVTRGWGTVEFTLEWSLQAARERAKNGNG